MARFLPLLLLVLVVYQARALGLTSLPPPNGQEWLVILNRVNTSENFNRSWDEYKKGFGHREKNDEGNFYIGNEKFHDITTKSGSTYRLRAEVQFKSKQQWHNIEFSSVTVDGEDNDYTINLSGEVGPEQSCLNASGNPRLSIEFSTYDHDKDNLAGKNCAAEYKGGWWFKDCNCACLTCDYDDKSLYWYRNGTLVAELSIIRMSIKQNDNN